jgi:hypothetical protein
MSLRRLGSPTRHPIGVKRRSVEGKEDGAPTGSQGDRQGRPYQNTVLFPLSRVLVRATLAVALQAV